jgi:hypothetical protein
MVRSIRCRLTYANVVATVALFVALGGTSYAALTVTGRNVKDSSLTGRDIRNSSITTADVKNGSLLARDFAAGQLPAGPRGTPGTQGAAGPKGDTGAKGDPGPKGEPGLTELFEAHARSAGGSSDEQYALALCPQGTVAIGGGYEIIGAPLTFMVYMDTTAMASSFQREGWIVRAVETTPVEHSWQIAAWASCA